MNVVEKFSNWISTERDRFDDRDNNVFANGFSDIPRYRRFLTLILARHKLAATAFVANTRAIFEAVSPQTADDKSLWWQLHLRDVQVTDELHLEIESFYLFAKILLDNVAHSIELYFGPARRLSLDSHDDLTKKFQEYAQSKSLVLSQEYVDQAAEMKRLICDYRDYHVQHEKSPRTIKGTTFSFTDSKVHLMQSRLYPTERDRQTESTSLQILEEKLDAYLLNVMGFLSANSNRTALRLAANAG